ncbi:MAG: YceI family protein [Acidimicrobiales bacterium]
MARFEISPDRSRVVIKARSSVHPIHSESRGLQGFLDLDVLDDGRLDLSGEPKGHLELATGRLESGNPLYDREMRRRVDATRFPLITGDLQAITEGDSAGLYLVRGELSFHGVTRTYTEEMSVSVPEPSVVEMTGSHVFDVRDFGVEPPRIMMIRVHPDVSVGVEISARRAR